MLETASTGLRGLDDILQKLRKGDNVVWQVDSIDDYRHFVQPYIQQALADNRRIVYIRFGKHSPLIEPNERIKTYELSAASGFESFSKQVHDIAAQEGEWAFYLFDCLSDLLLDWATDLMIGNFFMVTCPYLFKLNTIAYFAILRNNHSFKTIARIRETTQLLLDVYNIAAKYYVHPLKVWNRYSPTMFLPHWEKEGKYVPVTSSVDAAKLFDYMSDRGVESAQRNLDYWDRMFIRADESSRERIEKAMIGRESRMLGLAKENFSLADLIEIKARMIGTGFIGGKALGMLLARKILEHDKSFSWEKTLEPHDSFYIGSDVFYTYIVENGWWDLWLEQKTETGYFSKAAELKEKMLQGEFPEEIKEQFHQLIEYYGQSPIIVRSSSLLEDSFGNAFAGKYESIFCVNQGGPEERYQQFEKIVRQVYASTMNEEALTYRLQRGLSRSDEQMALLVQRVSGSHYQQHFFPFVAGVGFSYNTFVWHENMDPKAGMLRLVFGLGTRAVNRVEGDYPRIVALDAPLLKPYAGMANEKRFSQHEVDLLNITSNEIETLDLPQLLQTEKGIDLSLIGIRDTEAEIKLREMDRPGEAWILNFDKLLTTTDFTATMRRLLQVLEEKYQYPVDTEFTVNFNLQGKMQINLLQCRPLQARGGAVRVEIPSKLGREKLVFASEGNFMGGSVSQTIKRLIYVDPALYGDLLMPEKYEVARLIGRLNKQLVGQEKIPTMLIGPGRWGTRDPSLGVPVNFAEISNITALVEIDDPAGGFMPELSFGSHFFLDLVETDIFYAALFMDKGTVYFNKQWLDDLPASVQGKAVKVYDFQGRGLQLLSDITSQKVVCTK